MRQIPPTMLAGVVNRLPRNCQLILGVFIFRREDRGRVTSLLNVGRDASTSRCLETGGFLTGGVGRCLGGVGRGRCRWSELSGRASEPINELSKIYRPQLINER